MSVDTKTLDGVHISVGQSMIAFEPEWLALQGVAEQLPFMTFEWCKAWFGQNADDFRIMPLIVMGADENGSPLFILPLQKRRLLGLTIVEWLGQQANSACSGIFSPSFIGELGSAWLARNFADLLKLIGKIDLVNLRNMPATLSGPPSPLACLHCTEAANASFVTDLQLDYELLLRQKRSSRSISKMRRRDLRLEGTGTLTIQVLQGEAATEAVVEGLKHKNEQLKQAGVGDTFTAKDENHYKQILINASHVLQVFRLELDDKAIATMIGARTNSCFWLLISALAPDANLQFSPGDYLLRRTIAHCCNAGITRFDFCLGEQEYKQVWSDSRVPHYNYIRAHNLKALPFALALNTMESAKRFAKKNTVVRNSYYKFRQRLRGAKTKP